MQIYLDDNKYVTDKLFLAEIVSINKSEIYKNESRLFLLKKIYKMDLSKLNFSNSSIHHNAQKHVYTRIYHI